MRRGTTLNTIRAKNTDALTTSCTVVSPDTFWTNHLHFQTLNISLHLSRWHNILRTRRTSKMIVLIFIAFSKQQAHLSTHINTRICWKYHNTYCNIPLLKDLYSVYSRYILSIMQLDMSTLTVIYSRFLSVSLISHNSFVAQAVSCQPPNVEA